MKIENSGTVCAVKMIKPLVIFLVRDCHWLIPGHVALTIIKMYPDRDTFSNVPHSGYITARDQSMVESGVTEVGKNTASLVSRSCMTP